MNHLGIKIRLTFVIFLFSFTGSIAKYVNLSALALIFSRMFLASIALFLFLKWQKKSLKLSKKFIFPMICIGAFMAMNWLCFFYAIKISNISVVMASIPLGAVFTSFLEPIFFKTSFRLYQFFLAFIVVICTFSIFYNANNFQIKAMIFGAIAAFFSSLSAIIVKLLTKRKAVELVGFYQMSTGTIFSGIVFLSLGSFEEFFSLSLRDWFLIFLLGILFTAYLKLEVIKLIKVMNPYTFQLNVNLEPIYGILIAYLIFGESEKMDAKFYLSFFLMLTSILINQRLTLKFSKV